MVFDLSQVTGIGDYVAKTEAVAKDDQASHTRTLFLKASATAEGSQKAAYAVFLVDNGNTVELRCDEKLSSLLTEKYESIMRSRYFGTGGIEIVLAGNQLSESELCDLIRLSYNLTK